MDEKAKRRKFLKVALMFVIVMLCVITHIAIRDCVHDGALEKSYAVFSILNLAVESVGIGLIYKSLFRKG